MIGAASVIIRYGDNHRYALPEIQVEWSAERALEKAMDYEFTLDEYDRPIAEFSMGFEALGRWLTEELGADQHNIDDLLDIIIQLEQKRIGSRQLFGEDSKLVIDREQVEVMALALEIDDSDVDGEDSDNSPTLPENTRLYDDESYAHCGLQDFKQALLSWQAFVQD